MRTLNVLSFCLLFALASVAPAAAQDAAKIELTWSKVAGTVYMIHGTDEVNAFSGGNIAVSYGKDGVLMVDSKLTPISDKIRAAIREIGGDSPRFVVNTHVHGDHTGGNAAFGKEGTLVAQTNVRKRLMKDKPEAFWPVITFDESLAFHMNGEDISAVHYEAGHTDGDAVIYFEGSNVVHMGDLYFSGLFPFIDLENGGTVQGYMRNVKTILGKLPDDVKIVPGHGPLSSKSDFRTFYRMLDETTSQVTAAMTAGKSLDEIKAAGLTADWKSWSWQFISTDRWIETIYNSYSGELSRK